MTKRPSTIDHRPSTKNKRPGWDEYFLELAELVSKRATCLRRSVGAVLVKDKRILATGYNGAPSGITHCEITGCLREKLKVPSGERHELCLPPNEEVLTEEGYVPIHKVKLGQRVMTHKGIYRKVVKIFKREYEERLFYIEPWHLLPVALTPNHPVLAMKTEMCQFDSRTLCKEICRSGNSAYCRKPYLNYKLDWIPADKLNKKDILLLPFDNRSYSIEELDLSFVTDAPSGYYRVLEESDNNRSYREIERKLGVWPATAYNWTKGGVPRNHIAVYDGYLRHGSSPSKAIPSRVKITKELLRLIGFYLAEGCSSSNQLAFSFHKKETEYIDEIRTTMRKIFNLDCYENKQRNAHTLVYSSIILAKAFKTLFGAGAYTKKLPHVFMKLSQDKQKHILEAYAQGDSCYRIDDKTTTVSTASNELALQVRQILLRLGYLPIIDKGRGLYRLIWKEKIRIPYSYIKSDTFYTPIRKIWIKEYLGPVYNLEVERDNSYVTKSFVVHNCRGLHAEQNVLLQAALYGVTTRESILYITNQPCIICAKMIINAGIREIVTSGDYPDKMAKDFLREAKIKVRVVR